MAEKYIFRCWDCENDVQWKPSSKTIHCERCQSNIVKAIYPSISWGKLFKMFHENSGIREGLWRYYDILPLSHKKNIVSGGEGNVPVERWEFLEKCAKEQGGIECQVFAHRHDSHPSTGSFKDLAASMVSIALKEHNIRNYVVAITGNIGVAYARYLSASDCTLFVFIPHDSPKFKEAEIACFGQNVFRVDGDYAKTKKIAAQFADKHNILLGGDTFDPFRIEAKKTIAYEWYRQMEVFPDIYIQALSGGTGPLGVYKGCQELFDEKLINKLPRILLVQSEKCAPMAMAWQKSKKTGFKENWYLSYDKINDPKTEIPTLATGNPTAYPRLAKIIKELKGDIFSFPEKLAPSIAKIVAYEVGVRIGPAAAIGVGGFFSALNRRLIKDGDTIVIAIGEGIRRDPEFMIRLMNSKIPVSQVDDCKYMKREDNREDIWRPIHKSMSSLTNLN